MIPRTIFGAEHEMFRATVARFIEREVTPAYRRWEAEGQVPREVWRKAGEAGLLCPTVEPRYGGAGADFRYGAIVIEEMARAGAMAPTFYLHSEIVAPYLAHHGAEAQKQKWLPRMAAGETIVAMAMSEPSGGSDLQALKTTAIRDGDHYVVNGQKVFITNGVTADLIVLACKTDPGAGARGVSLLLVETDRPGFSRGRALEKIGAKAQDTAELFFSDLRVPAENLLGPENGGFYILMRELAQERLIQAIRGVASCEAALRWTIDYVSQREMFGHTLADFQNTQFKLAEMHADTLVQRVFVDRCIELHLEGKLSADDAAAAKMVTTELQGRVMDQCLQFFGGWGYMAEYPIARAFVDARLTRIGGGSIEVMKQIIGRSLLPTPESRGAMSNDGEAPAYGYSDEALAALPTVFQPGLFAAKTVLVSGAGTGLGKAIALLFARLGARLVICGRTREKLEAAAPLFEAAGAEVLIHPMTIRDPDQVAGLFDAAARRFGGVDVLVNNAGGQFPQAAIDFTPKGWRSVIDTNLNGTWYMMQAAARRWIDAGRTGSIVNIVATVWRGRPTVAHTCAARAGVIYLSKSVAVEWAEHGLRVNCVAPGVVETTAFSLYPEAGLKTYQHDANPMRRPGDVQDIAEACVYLSASSGKFITGEVITVDGGQQVWGDPWPGGRPDYFE